METNTPEYGLILKSVTESRCFGRSERQLRLFKYLLEKTYSSESHTLKQYAIALDVFDRPASFDQQTDSIVRVEMHRLRGNLSKFNAKTQDVQITIPKGQFNVVVKYIEKKNPKASSKINKVSKYAGVCGALLAAVLFLSLIRLHQIESSASTERLTCSEFLPNMSIVIEQTSGESVAEIERFLLDGVSQFTNFNIAKEDCRGVATPALQLHYSNPTSQTSPTIFVTRFGDSVPILLQHIKATPADSRKNDFKEEVSKNLSQMLKPYGSLSNTMLLETWNSASAKEHYRCLIAMHNAYGSEIEDEYLSVHRCLEKAVKSGPTASDVQGGLAASYVGKYLSNPDADKQDTLFKAKAILDAHEDDWIESAEMSLAKMMFEANRPDYAIDRFRGVTSRVAERYSSNPQVLLTAAGYMGFWIGDWESAHAWSLRAKSIHTDRDHSVFIVDVAYALLDPNNTDLKNDCILAYSETSVLANLIVNACAKKEGDEPLIELTDKNLLKYGMNNSRRIAYITNRNFEPKITKTITKLNSSENIE